MHNSSSSSAPLGKSFHNETKYDVTRSLGPYSLPACRLNFEVRNFTDQKKKKVKIPEIHNIDPPPTSPLSPAKSINAMRMCMFGTVVQRTLARKEAKEGNYAKPIGVGLSQKPRQKI